MPYEILNHGSYYTVKNKDSGQVKSYHTTLDKAKCIAFMYCLYVLPLLPL